MAEITIIGIDLAKRCFQLHAADGAGRVVFRQKLTRSRLLEFLATVRFTVTAH